MKQPIVWKDHVVEYPNRYTETDLGGGYIQHNKAPGEVIQQGTPMSAKNFNDMDLGGIQGILMGAENAAQINWLKQKVDGLEGEQIEVELTNSRSYPFNNSQKTIQLSQDRNTKNYSVIVEVLEKTGGGVGDIIISDKLLNGFKIAFTGAATAECKRDGSGSVTGGGFDILESDQRERCAGGYECHGHPEMGLGIK